MRFILDANALIYLVKTDLAQEGIENKYPDAYIAKDFLEKNQIPIIPVDIKSELPKFRDPGETSCYILAKEEGVCISSDVRANKKLKNLNVAFLELDTFFYNQLMKKTISKKRFIEILNDLKLVNGTSANRISVFLELLSKEGEKDE